MLSCVAIAPNFPHVVSPEEVSLMLEWRPNFGHNLFETPIHQKRVGTQNRFINSNLKAVSVETLIHWIPFPEEKL